VLLARHGRAAYATALAIVGDPDAAEDVCQDALFRVWQRLGECRTPERFGAWMVSAVRRHALNALRGRRPRASLDPDRVLWSGPSPAQVAEQKELRDRLLRALATLSPEQRQAVLLFDLAEWSHARIAEALDTTEAMSRQHLMQGRRRLRRLLEGKELES
jgi:RNA polymerase sigma-70 factor (ECF subfamily)